MRCASKTADGRSAWGAAAETAGAEMVRQEPRADRTRTISISCGWRFGSPPRPIRGRARHEPRSAISPRIMPSRSRPARSTASTRSSPISARRRSTAPMLDALCRMRGCSFYEARARQPARHRSGVVAGQRATSPVSTCRASSRELTPGGSVAARHTVGLVDVIGRPPGHRSNDGLPESLEEVVAAYGHRYFKLKVGGDLDADLARLTEIAAVLDRAPTPYVVSLDGNEQYDDIGALLDAVAADAGSAGAASGWSQASCSSSSRSPARTRSMATCRRCRRSSR